MRRLICCLLFLLSFFGCSTNTENQLDIVLQFAQSTKIDFKASTYTVYFIAKDPVIIHFTLSEKEKNEVIQIKKSLLMNWEPVRTTIEDSCWHDPKLYTRITINSKKGLSIIDIDNGCNGFYPSNSDHAIRLKEFIKKIKEIVKSKKEVKDAPETDISYF
jgi:hypothetical protein